MKNTQITTKITNNYQNMAKIAQNTLKFNKIWKILNQKNTIFHIKTACMHHFLIMLMFLLYMK